MVFCLFICLLVLITFEENLPLPQIVTFYIQHHLIFKFKLNDTSSWFYLQPFVSRLLPESQTFTSTTWVFHCFYYWHIQNPTSIPADISKCFQQNFRLWNTFCQVKKRQNRVMSLGGKSFPGRVKTSSLPVRFR